MPFLILAALVVIVLMLYIALGGKEGAPTISLNKIFDFVTPKPPADGEAQDASASEAKPAEAAAPEAATAAEAPKAAEEAPAADQAEGVVGPDGAVFSSMEELTEFYRKEAERLTGIKH
jgi:hypothetical protein